MEWILYFAAIGLLFVGLIGQGYEMKKLREREPEGVVSSKKIFFSKSNVKWYLFIAAALIIWAIYNDIT